MVLGARQVAGARPRPVATLQQSRPECGRGAGGRLHLAHGPINLIFDIGGAPEQVARAEALACGGFDGLLETLVRELPLLRRPVAVGSALPEGVVAQAMMRAALPFADDFVTPMAAVAGAVADHMLAVLRAEAGLTRVIVNNGGDIALHLTGAERYRIGIHDFRHHDRFAGTITLGAADRVGGIATSGWRGRSHSLGIADAVTVLAPTAAEADVAATLIANAVDLPNASEIHRAEARTLSPDSDLGERLVTIGVDTLAPPQVAKALAAGVARAEEYLARGLIRAAFLVLQGEVRIVGSDTLGKALSHEGGDDT